MERFVPEDATMNSNFVTILIGKEHLPLSDSFSPGTPSPTSGIWMREAQKEPWDRQMVWWAREGKLPLFLSGKESKAPKVGIGYVVSNDVPPQLSRERGPFL